MCKTGIMASTADPGSTPDLEDAARKRQGGTPGDVGRASPAGHAGTGEEPSGFGPGNGGSLEASQHGRYSASLEIADPMYSPDNPRSPSVDTSSEVRGARSLGHRFSDMFRSRTRSGATDFVPQGDSPPAGSRGSWTSWARGNSPNKPSRAESGNTGVQNRAKMNEKLGKVASSAVDIKNSFTNVREKHAHADASGVLSELREIEMRMLDPAPTFIPWIKRTWVNMMFGMLILVNSGCIGLDLELQDEKGNSPAFMMYLESFFLVSFWIEIALRLRTDGCKKFCLDPWGPFDTSCTFLGSVDAWVLTPLSGSSGSLAGFSALRTLRLLRLMRLIRVFRVFTELTALVKILISSFHALWWSTVLMFFVVYISSVTVMTALKGSVDVYQGDDHTFCPPSNSSEEEACYPDDLSRLARGMGWLFVYHIEIATGEGFLDHIIEPMASLNPLWRLYWVFTVVLMNFFMLNLVVGLVVTRTLGLAQEEEEVFQEFIKESDQFARTLQSLFETMDTDQSMTITRNEAKDVLSSPVMLSILDAFGIKTDVPLRLLMTVLGLTNNTEVSFDQFRENCVRLCGTKRDIRSFMLQVDCSELKRQVGGRLHDLCASAGIAGNLERFHDLEALLRRCEEIEAIPLPQYNVKPRDSVASEASMPSEDSGGGGGGGVHRKSVGSMERIKGMGMKGKFVASQEIQYYHKTGWVRCRVLQVREDDGAVMIDLKKGEWLGEEQKQKLRPLAAPAKLKTAEDIVSTPSADVLPPLSTLPLPPPGHPPQHSKEMSTTGCCREGHPLTALGSALAPLCASKYERWYCDAQYDPGGCQNGETGSYLMKGMNRFHCEVCEYDLCEVCVRQVMLLNDPDAARQVKEGLREDTYTGRMRSNNPAVRFQDELSHRGGSTPSTSDTARGDGYSLPQYSASSAMDPLDTFWPAHKSDKMEDAEHAGQRSEGDGAAFLAVASDVLGRLITLEQQQEEMLASMLDLQGQAPASAAHQLPCCRNGHVLALAQEANPRYVMWSCDGALEQGGCRNGDTATHRNVGIRRYYCARCCYDLCEKCHEAMMISGVRSFAMRDPTSAAGGWTTGGDAAWSGAGGDAAAAAAPRAGFPWPPAPPAPPSANMARTFPPAALPGAPSALGIQGVLAPSLSARELDQLSHGFMHMEDSILQE